MKDLLTTSEGELEPDQRFYRDLEPKLAMAQRPDRKHRVEAIHARIANRRKDLLHKLSTELVRTHQAVFVGNVNGRALTQTKMAKSVWTPGGARFEPCCVTSAMTQACG